MTDKLKLADPNGDLELSKTVLALELEAHQKRLRQMEQNVAELEKLLAEKKKANAADRQRRAASANNKIGARKDASFKAISTAPSINLTPRGRGMVPVPYPVVQDLAGSVKASSSVRFNGKPAYLLDQTTQSSCTGDAAGTGGGVKSGTVGGEVKPVEGSRSVRIEGKRVVREGDACTMNGGNNPGIYVTVPATSPAPPRDAIKTSNPPIRPPSDDLDPIGEPGNPLGLPQRPLAEQIRATMLRGMADGSAARQQATAMFQAKPTGPLLVADDGRVEASRLRTGNSLGMALLGPLFGAPGAAARALGANEQQVAAGNEVGSSLMGVALSLGGLPSRQSIPLAPKLTQKPPVAQTKPPGGGVKVAGKDTTRISNELINLATKQKIMAIPKGFRPDPSTYISKNAIDEHLKKFDSGGSYLVPKDVLDKYGRDLLGHPDNSQFIMRKTEMDQMLLRANGDISIVETELGIPSGAWQGKELVRIDIAIPRELNLRMPSGNESGANKYWIPGGQLPTGQLEATINSVPKGQYMEGPLWH